MEDAANDLDTRLIIGHTIGYKPDKDTWKYLPVILRSHYIDAVRKFIAKRAEISKALDVFRGNGKEREVSRHKYPLMLSFCFLRGLLAVTG